MARDINFSINCRDFICVAGENGSGKTILLKGLLRLIAQTDGTLSFSNELKQTGTGYLSQEAVAKKIRRGFLK